MSYKVSLNIIITQDSRKLYATSVESLRVEKSLHTLVDTAIVRLPITARLDKEGVLSPSEDVAKVFHENDLIEIQLGHDDQLNSEFKGFIKRVNLSDPCEIECEGYSWQLRRKAPVKSWKTVTLKEVLNTLIEGTDIVLHADVANVTMSPFYMGLKGENGIEVIEELKKYSDESLIAYFIDGNQLYVGPYGLAQTDKAVTYSLGWNTLEDEELKFRRAEDVKVHVTYTWKDEDGKAHHGTAGESGGLEINFTNLGRFANAEAAKNKALAMAKLHQYEGYEGRITALWVPYCQPGFKANLLDDQYNERQQSCIAEGITVILDDRGDERIIELGQKVNKQK